jgi:hypothetical protein
MAAVVLVWARPASSTVVSHVNTASSYAAHTLLAYCGRTCALSPHLQSTIALLLLLLLALLLLLQINTRLAGGTSKGELTKLGQLQVGRAY